MTIETLTNILYIWLSVSLLFPALAFWIIYKNRRLKNELEKQNLANRFYEEMLYASRDGYLTDSVYKKKEYHFCSRRLATLLNLKKGEKSSLEDILSVFTRADAEKINTLYAILKKDGTAFETLAKTKSDKTFTVAGVRINSADSVVTSNCLWFRDMSKTTNFIDRVTEEAFECRKKLEDYRILIDNLPCPVWLRDENLEISLLNRKYLHLLGLKDFKDINAGNSTLHDLGNTTNLMELAKNAKDSNTPQKKQISILNNGDLKRYEITETPYYDSSLKTTRTIGSLIDITGFEEAKRSYQDHLDSHLDILDELDTAFCIINNKHHFSFGNSAFLKLWNLPETFINNTPHYNQFLDTIREKKTLPEVPDFKLYKEEENKAFDSLREPDQDLLDIPDGRTFRRIRAPHPDGTLIAYQDITDRLTIERRLSESSSIQQSILDNIGIAAVIFSPNMKLKSYNTQFAKLWNISEDILNNSPSLRDILNNTKDKLPEIENWDSFREDMIKHVTAHTAFILKLKNKQRLNVTSSTLPDSSLMITCSKP